jgi:hypothetical protein
LALAVGKLKCGIGLSEVTLLPQQLLEELLARV